MTIIRITQHPHTPDVAIIHSPPDWASNMGRFAPARYDRDKRAYLLDNEHVDAFMKFAGLERARVIDERRAPTRAALGPNPLPECANCGQPGSRTNPPRTCPGCGQAWVEFTFHDTAPGAVRAECPSCRYRQSGKFPFCSQCGAEMAYAPPGKVPEFVHQTARRKLEEPMPLGDVLAEAIPADHAPAHATPEETA